MQQQIYKTVRRKLWEMWSLGFHRKTPPHACMIPAKDVRVWILQVWTIYYYYNCERKVMGEMVLRFLNEYLHHSLVCILQILCNYWTQLWILFSLIFTLKRSGTDSLSLELAQSKLYWGFTSCSAIFQKNQGVFVKHYSMPPAATKSKKLFLASRSKSRSQGHWPWCHLKGHH